MRVGMVFRGFGGMMRGMHGMSVRDMRMMSRLFVVAFFVMFCCLAVMFCRVFVMLGSRFMMLGFGFAGHCCSPCMRGEAARKLWRDFMQEA
jgi:hypothetical protein